MDKRAYHNPFDEDDNPRQKWLTLFGSVAFAVICCVFLTFGYLYFRPDQLARLGQYFPSPTITPTFTQTFTPAPTLTPTLIFTPTKTLTPTITPSPTPNLTAQAYENTVIEIATDWNVAIEEDFASNDYDWYIEEDDTDLVRIAYSIEDGKYIWSTQAYDGFVQRMNISSDSVRDFYFSVEVTQPDLTAPADQGFTFREDEEGRYYYFSLNNKGYFELWMYFEGWIEMVGATDSTAIRPQESNQVAVLAEGDRFVFFINGQYVLEVTDATLPAGMVGLAAGVHESDVEVVFEFDNISLQTP